MSNDTDAAPSKRARRAEPITRRTAKNGTVAYKFQLDIGVRPDGSRERQRFTFPTLVQARREYRRISTDVAAGTFVKRNPSTVAEFLMGWLDSRRDIRPNTLQGYRNRLKPVIEHLGEMTLQQLRTADVDALVILRLAGKRVAQRDKRGRRAAEVLAFLRSEPDGTTYSDIYAALGNSGIKALDRLVTAGDVLRPTRGRYLAAQPADPQRPKISGGVTARTVVSTLVVLSAALDDAMRQGLVTRNVARMVKRPAIKHYEMATWTPQQATQFRDHIREDRLAACWLLTLAGLRDQKSWDSGGLMWTSTRAQ